MSDEEGTEEELYPGLSTCSGLRATNGRVDRAIIWTLNNQRQVRDLHLVSAKDIKNLNPEAYVYWKSWRNRSSQRSSITQHLFKVLNWPFHNDGRDYFRFLCCVNGELLVTRNTEKVISYQQIIFPEDLSLLAVSQTLVDLNKVSADLHDEDIFRTRFNSHLSPGVDFYLGEPLVS